MATTNGNYSWIVVSDPLEVGGFLPDTRFSEEDVVHMLRFKTFTLGTVLRHRIYGKFQVILGGRQELAYKMINSKYYARVGNGQKLVLHERERQHRSAAAGVAG